VNLTLESWIPPTNLSTLLGRVIVVCSANPVHYRDVFDLPVAIVVGDYLYLDGGEVYVNESGAVAVYPGLLPPRPSGHQTIAAFLTRVQRIPPTPSI
jgi:hypothetical protein